METVRMGEMTVSAAKGYELVAVTTHNCLFVRRDYFAAFGIEDNSAGVFARFGRTFFRHPAAVRLAVNARTGDEQEPFGRWKHELGRLASEVAVGDRDSRDRGHAATANTTFPRRPASMLRAIG